jgi:putative oxidoreductase
MLKRLIVQLSLQADYGLMALRVMMGIILTYQGWLKITELGFAVGFFDKVGIPFATVTGPFISMLEFIGGLALIVGLFVRYLGTLFVIQFIVAAYVQWVVLNTGYMGSRLVLLILFGVVMLSTNGGGALSLDRVFKRWEP